MGKLKLSPFYLAVFIYTVSNIIFAIMAIHNKEMSVEFYSYSVESDLMLKALCLQTVSLFFLIFLFRVFDKRITLKQLETKSYGFFAGRMLLGYQVFYLLLVLFFNVGVVGQHDYNINYGLLVLVNIFSSDTLFFIIGSQLRSNNLFRINALVYLISSLLRGWMGGILLVFFVYLCRVKFLKVSLRSFLLYFLLAFFIILILPFLIDLKFGIRSGNISFDVVNYSENLELAIEYIMGRFQHVGHIYILLSKSTYYYEAYQNLKIRSFLLEGNIQYSLFDNLLGVKGVQLSEFMVNNEFGSNWNTNTGLVGWWVVLKESIIFFIVYWGGVIASTYYLIHKYATRQLFLVYSVFMVVYFYHGWLSAFFNMTFLIWILIFIKRIKI